MAGLMSRREALVFSTAGLSLAAMPWPVIAAGADDWVDALASRFMAQFEVPGAAIAIVRPGQPALARGYGIRKLGARGAVDPDTLFAIASNSKSFVAAGLAMMVDQGRVRWEQPVVELMPDFAMSDPAVTRMMTVRDLLTHRSGLALGAGDLMQFPLSDHRREEFLAGLKYLPLARGFRSGYAYDNILYVVAGILIERLSGKSWEAYTTDKLLRPLAMPDAVAGRSFVRTDNISARHARIGPPSRGLGTLTIVEADESPAAGSAGGLQLSARDIVKWLEVQLGRGATPDGRRFWSEAQSDEMWTPQIITKATKGPIAGAPTDAVLQTYGLGWFIQDFRGRRLIHHGGALSGQATQTALLPEQGIGLAVFTNTENRIPALALRSALLDRLLGVDSFDWLTWGETGLAKEDADVRALLGQGDFAAPPGGPSLPLAAYVGRYRDPWYGDIVITKRGSGLAVDFTRTPVFKSALEPFGPDAFRTRFKPGTGEDAVITFHIAAGRITGMKLKALSPIADFSYDFHDLNPVRVD